MYYKKVIQILYCFNLLIFKHYYGYYYIIQIFNTILIIFKLYWLYNKDMHLISWSNQLHIFYEKNDCN